MKKIFVLTFIYFIIYACAPVDSDTLPPTILTKKTEAYTESPFIFKIDVVDEVGDTLIILPRNLPDWLTWDGENRELKGTPSFTAINSEEKVSIFLSDGKNRVTETLSIKIIKGNSPPVFRFTPLTSTNKGKKYKQNIDAYDSDGDDIQYNLEIPHWLNFDENSSMLTGVPGNDDIGQHKVHLSITDGKSASISTEYIIQVKNINQSPEIVISKKKLIINMDETFEFPFTISDPDEDDIDVTISDQPEWLELTYYNDNEYILWGEPTTSDLGKSDITIIAKDSNSGRDDATLNIEVFDPNIKNSLDFLPVQYADIDPTKTYYNSSDLEQKINEIKSMYLEEDLVAILPLGGKTIYTIWIVDPYEIDKGTNHLVAGSCIEIKRKFNHPISIKIKSPCKIYLIKQENIFVFE